MKLDLLWDFCFHACSKNHRELPSPLQVNAGQSHSSKIKVGVIMHLWFAGHELSFTPLQACCAHGRFELLAAPVLAFLLVLWHCTPLVANRTIISSMPVISFITLFVKYLRYKESPFMGFINERKRKRSSHWKLWNAWNETKLVSKSKLKRQQSSCARYFSFKFCTQFARADSVRPCYHCRS